MVKRKCDLSSIRKFLLSETIIEIGESIESKNISISPSGHNVFNRHFNKRFIHNCK